MPPKQPAINDDDDAVEWEGFGQKAKVPTKAITGGNLLVLIMFGVILWSQWQLFGLIGKLIESVDRNTYMLSLNQADREAMRPLMPPSFQQKSRRERE